MIEVASVYVVDNAEPRSARAIAFVKTKWPRDVVEAAIIGWSPHANIVGVFNSVAWWKGKFELLEQLVFIHRLNHLPPEVLFKIPIEFLESVLRLGLSHQDHLDELARRIDSMRLVNCQ